MTEITTEQMIALYKRCLEASLTMEARLAAERVHPEITPAQIAVLHLQPNDILFVDAECIAMESITGMFPCPIVAVNCRSGLSVAEHLAVVRKEEAGVIPA